MDRERILHKYRQVAYLSYNILFYFKHSLPSEYDTLFFFDVKHIQDSQYTSVTISIPNISNFEKVFQAKFFTICEQFYKTFEYAPQKIKTKKKVSFNTDVHVRLIGGEQLVEYNIQLL